MSTKRYQPILWIVMSFIFIVTLLVSSLLAPAITQADLPDRDTPTPSSADNKGDSGGDAPLLAHIELFVSPTPIGVEAAVQWQDPQGNWHDVTGWTRVLQNGYERWTVEAKDFGTGPFRWQVRTGGPDGVVVGSSEPFSLPAGAGETLPVHLSTGS